MERITSFDEAREFIATRRKRKLGNNTYLTFSPLEGKRVEDRQIVDQNHHGIAIKYHRTNVVTFWNGGIILNSDGWQTLTTKARINHFLPSGQWDGYNWTGVRACVWQQLGKWYLSTNIGCFDYFDGMVMLPDGNVWRGTLANVARDKREYNRRKARERREHIRNGDRWNGRTWTATHYWAEMIRATDRGNGGFVATEKPTRTREEVMEEIERRRDNVLAECSKRLPMYNAR